MKRLSWKYIAGFIDGEGCLDVQQTKIKGRDTIYVRPRVRIAQVHYAKFVLEYLQNSHGGHIAAVGREFKNPNWNDAASWELTGYNLVSPFLRNLKEHLLIKKEQANLLLWLESNVKGRQVTPEVRRLIRDELTAMKRDPHRLSVVAQDRILEML